MQQFLQRLRYLTVCHNLKQFLYNLDPNFGRLFRLRILKYVLIELSVLLHVASYPDEKQEYDDLPLIYERRRKLGNESEICEP